MTTVEFGSDRYVGEPAARGELRRLARVGVAAQKDVFCIYAGLDEAADRRSSKKKFWSEAAVVAPRPRPSTFAAECEAVLCAHAALSHGAALRENGQDALVVLDGLEPLVDLWKRSTAILTDRFGAANVGLGDDSECRAFFSAALQRAGRSKSGGSLTVVALTSDEKPRDEDDEAPAAATAYALSAFEAAGARESIMTRLRALDAKGIALTDDILGKIGVAAPNAGSTKRPDAPGKKRRSEACADRAASKPGFAHQSFKRTTRPSRGRRQHIDAAKNGRRLADAGARCSRRSATRTSR